MKLVFSKRAHHDLNRIRTFLEKKSPKAASNAAQRIKTVMGYFLEHPRMGRLVLSPEGYREDIREFPVRIGADGYLIRYQIRPGSILILRIWNFKENHD